MSREAMDRPLRVLALIDHFVLGGAETMLTRFALGADQAGLELTVACLHDYEGNPAAAPLVARGTPPINLGLHGRPGPRTLGVLRALIRGSHAEIVHTHLGNSDLLGGLAARSLGVPVVSTLHTTSWSGRRDRVMRPVVGMCCARIIAVSDAARAEYLRLGWAREDQLVTIHNGIDVDAKPGAGRRIRHELGIAEDDLVVMMVSALRPEKGHDLALAALQRLRERYPRLRLVIVGQGDLLGELRASAEQSGGWVTVTGLRDDVMALLDAADICLHPSRREALPTTLIEAMAAGVPVVATGVGGIPEMITDGVDGLLVPAPPVVLDLAVALERLLADPEARQAIGTAGRRTYNARFRAGPWIARTRALYQDVLVERARR